MIQLRFWNYFLASHWRVQGGALGAEAPHTCRPRKKKKKKKKKKGEKRKRRKERKKRRKRRKERKKAYPDKWI